MRIAPVLIAVLAIGCKKSSRDEKASAIVDDKPKRDDAGKGGAPPPDVTGRGSGPGAGRGVSLEFLDGDLEISAGAIDKDAVRRVVKDNTTKLQYCYEKTLLATPGIEGKVIAKFTIAPEGHVLDVKTSGVHPDVEACVAEAVKSFKFPPSQTKVDVSYPFTFKPA